MLAGFHDIMPAVALWAYTSTAGFCVRLPSEYTITLSLSTHQNGDALFRMSRTVTPRPLGVVWARLTLRISKFSPFVIMGKVSRYATMLAL